VPGGQTVIEEGDILLTIVNDNNLNTILDAFSRPAAKK